MEPRSSWDTDAGHSAWGKSTDVWRFSGGGGSQVVVAPSQLGKSASPVHFPRLPGTNSSTRIRCVGPPKPKVPIEPTFGSALLSEVQKPWSPWTVETAL